MVIQGPADAANQYVSWESSNEEVAVVDTEGKVTAEKAGNAVVKVITRNGRFEGACRITVKGNTPVSDDTQKEHPDKDADINADINTDIDTDINTDKNKDMNADRKVTNKTLKWKSSNSKYAAVNKKGKVTAKKAGKGRTVTITAASTDGSGKKAKIKIKIR